MGNPKKFSVKVFLFLNIIKLFLHQPVQLIILTFFSLGFFHLRCIVIVISDEGLFKKMW